MTNRTARPALATDLSTGRTFSTELGARAGMAAFARLLDRTAANLFGATGGRFARPQADGSFTLDTGNRTERFTLEFFDGRN